MFPLNMVSRLTRYQPDPIKSSGMGSNREGGAPHEEYPARRRWRKRDEDTGHTVTRDADGTYVRDADGRLIHVDLYA